MYKESIQNTIDYMEANLRAEMTAAELAEQAGYSLFHFYRIFQSEVGMPVMQYILRRKLLNAIYEIGSGRKKIDVALEYGFETYAGFYKSFVRELGYTPAAYLRKFKVKKPYRINIFQEEHIMLMKRRRALSETYEEGNVEKLQKWISVMKEIMLGYDAVVHLSDEEKEAIPYVILSNQLLATAWFAGKEKYQSIFEVNRKMTNWIIQSFEQLSL